MITFISLINLASVGIFGVVLSASFCDIVWTRQKRRILAGGTAFILLLQGIVYYLCGNNEAIVKTLYPIITHLPLIFLLGALTKQYLWSVVSILTAYLFCQIRRWLALFIVAIFSGNSQMQNMAEFIITLPLLFILLKFVASAIRSISHYTLLEKYQFGLVPAIYYSFDYLTRVYTHLYAANSLLIIEFMQFVCGGIYIMFVLYSSKGERIRRQLQQTQEILNLQVSQAARQIESLRESQQAANVYHHDLRHHMQYLSSCIENERLKQAQDYIQAVCSEIEANKVVIFCENETVNLILSSFAGRAEHYNIPMDIKAAA